MKGKYITTQLAITSKGNQQASRMDVHAALQNTVNERKKILKMMEETLRRAEVIRIFLGLPNAA